VFLDQSGTPAANLVGGLNQGWTVAKSLLGFERIHIRQPEAAGIRPASAAVGGAPAGLPAGPVFRDRLARLQLDVAHLGDLYGHFAAIVGRGEQLGPEVSVLKIWPLKPSSALRI